MTPIVPDPLKAVDVASFNDQILSNPNFVLGVSGSFFVLNLESFLMSEEMNATCRLSTVKNGKKYLGLRNPRCGLAQRHFKLSLHYPPMRKLNVLLRKIAQLTSLNETTPLSLIKKNGTGRTKEQAHHKQTTVGRWP